MVKFHHITGSDIYIHGYMLIYTLSKQIICEECLCDTLVFTDNFLQIFLICITVVISEMIFTMI